MDDKIEATRERVEECRRLVIKLLDEYNCYIYYNNKDAEVKVYNTGLEADGQYIDYEVEV